jgi:cation transport protein ChaC
MRLRTDEELESTLQAVLARHDAASDVHVFAYGSLMWTPGVEHSGQAPARVHGWHRDFCLRTVVGRGSPAQPGLMLALDRGGSCNGTVLRISAARARAELALLWRREMTTASYDARWVKAWTESGPVDAITFVISRKHERYVNHLGLEEMAGLINTGVGLLGTCRCYFDSLVGKLHELGIHDRRMQALSAAVGASGPPMSAC